MRLAGLQLAGSDRLCIATGAVAISIVLASCGAGAVGLDGLHTASP